MHAPKWCGSWNCVSILKSYIYIQIFTENRYFNVIICFPFKLSFLLRIHRRIFSCRMHERKIIIEKHLPSKKCSEEEITDRKTNWRGKKIVGRSMPISTYRLPAFHHLPICIFLLLVSLFQCAVSLKVINSNNRIRGDSIETVFFFLILFSKLKVNNRSQRSLSEHWRLSWFHIRNCLVVYGERVKRVSHSFGLPAI